MLSALLKRLCFPFLLLLTACGGVEVQVTNGSDSSLQSTVTVHDRVTFRFNQLPESLESQQSQNMSSSVQENFIIQDASKLAETQQLFWPNDANTFLFQNVDFNTQQIVGVLRSSNSGCDYPWIRSILVKETVFEIEVVQATFGENVYCTTDIGFSVQFALTDRISGLPAQFIDLNETLVINPNTLKSF